ncbi:cytoplasmic dynein 2 intermediate chain 1 isoform X2 [Pelmatolapia mariae]|uniref:cytoplasmic dynein 2 intermediate chain 1 isoform X2 n=1 Tax=Pelmatolapia mariae TaxID=158779 RepID=UPI002FE52DE8
MYTDKKITKEDTWRPADLRRHIREEERGGDDARRRDGYDRRYLGGESTERRHRDPEKESRREKERLRERESTGRERRDEGKKDRRKEGSQDRRAERGNERETTRERERFVDVRKYGDDYRENKEKRRDLEEKHDRERDKERHRDKEKERVRDRDRHREEDRSKRRDDRDKERKREERDRELRDDGERRRHKESREGRGAQIEQHHREEKDQHRERERHQNEYEDTRNAKEERHRDMKHSEQKEDREYKEEHRKRKEERERRHRERGHHEEKQKHDSEYREHRGEEIRHHRADRERAERDKPKDRRYKEGEDPENKHRERRHKHEADVERKHKERKHREEDDHRDKKSSSGKSHERNVVETEEVDLVSEQWIPAVKHEADTEEPQVVNDEDLADQEYEDDFEDYEEDFEELNESTNEDEDEKEPLHPQAGEGKEELSAQRRKEIEAIRRAMDEENERIGTTQSRQSTSREEEEERPKWSRDTERIQSRASQRGKFIDFVAAKQREVSKKVASKQKKRSTELLRLIDLDFSMTFSLLDLPPVNEYDMYIRNFGNANTKQAYVQCNEDNTDRDIQTEEIEMSEKWTQHPPERSGACGDPNLSKEARDKQRSELNYDSQRLASFLHSASQVMVVLLEEDQAERKSLEKLSTQSDTLSFSDGSLQLITELPFLYDRQISMLHFSQVQKHTMLSVHMPTTKPSAKHLDSCTIICIWNIWEPSRPQKILVYESEIQCCCFSPGKVTLVFAGTSVGSVVLWDLREQSSNHYSLKMGEKEWTFRQPTFSTDAVLAASGHLSSVTSVEVVPSALAGDPRADVPLLASEEESSGLSFQLASLDESGVLNFWVVVELPKGNEAGSPTDLGLRPGGKVKLLHSSSVLAAERGSPRDVVKTGPLHTLLLKFLPTDSNHFFIGTNMGLVHHGTSHGLKAPPKCYRFQEVEVQPVDVTSIHFSPFRPHLFLVGCGNGSIRLHAVSHEQPVAQWKNSTAGEPVVSLQWAQTRATVFCVLDAACNLHIWDLLKDDTQPVVTERMSADRVTDMALFGQSGKQNTYSGVALAHESGKIEMQYFKRSLTVSSTAEEEKLLERMTTEAF